MTKFLELFVKAHKAIIKKIVVGMPGTNIPIKPRLTQSQPRDIRIILFIRFVLLM